MQDKFFFSLVFSYVYSVVDLFRKKTSENTAL